jgi:hypothetical protein
VRILIVTSTLIRRRQLDATLAPAASTFPLVGLCETTQACLRRRAFQLAHPAEPTVSFLQRNLRGAQLLGAEPGDYALRGLISPAGKTVGRAESLVRALAAVSGLATAARGLIGLDVMTLASSSAVASDLPVGFSSRVPVPVMAAGRAIAAELPAERLDAQRLLESLAGSAPIPDLLAGAGPREAVGHLDPRRPRRARGPGHLRRRGPWRRDRPRPRPA